MIARMDIGNIPLFAAITRRMAWLGDRQTVLAENVANANTPGYLEKDLKEPDFKTLVQGAPQGIQLAATNPAHLSGTAIAPRPDLIETTTDRTLNGNGVSIEAQMMKVSSNAADYALTATLYKEHIAMLKTALDNGSSG